MRVTGTVPPRTVSALGSDRYRLLELSSAGMLLRVALVLCALAGAARGDSRQPRSCADLRQFYSGNGFSLSGVPQAEISGEHLRVCPQGYTCCTSQMEENLSNLSSREFGEQVKESGRTLQASLNSQYKSFDGYFRELLNRSEASLQDSFQTGFGSLYSQNSRIFQELYSNLRHYYRGSNLNLEEALNEFWGVLLERLLRVFNSQFSFGEDYLECVSKQSETLRPFGETPRDFKLKVTRTFVAARSFVQGLVVAGEVVRKVSQKKRLFTFHFQPKLNFFSTTIKRCLFNFYFQPKLDIVNAFSNQPLFNHYTMLQVSDKLNRPYSMDAAVLSMPRRIAEAVLYMQDNLNTFNRVTGRPNTITPKGHEQLIHEIHKKQPRTTFKELVNLCMWCIRYLPEVMGDGLASQINNPEVEIDITKPDMTIRQQIMQLKIMTNRLKNAINGNDVDFQDTSDDISGSGSGMCSEVQCARGPRIMVPSTNRPRNYPNQSENKKVVKGLGSRNAPCSALYLLLALVTALLRR
uniref:Glypican-1 n=1 Tax=Astyanax mexicanus TaxID=7994 RepID=A0A8B9KVK1_ASTMX